MAINDDAARHFARAMVTAGRSRLFVLETMASYYGEVGQAVALDVLSELSDQSSVEDDSDNPSERVAEYIALGRRS
jgi:hypothetical protein